MPYNPVRKAKALRANRLGNGPSVAHNARQQPGVVNTRRSRVTSTTGGAKARRRPPNPLRLDPTRTTTLRRLFVQDLSVRFLRLKTAVTKLVVEDDAFGLKGPSRIAFNQRKYSSTQVNIYDFDTLATIKAVQRSLDANDVLELEEQPHITVRYGLHTTDPKPVQALLAGHGMIAARIRRLSLFQNKDADVLKADVESEGLHRLHHRLGILPHTDTHPEYIPHLTIAYLKSGTGAKYVDSPEWILQVGKPQVFFDIGFSPPSRIQTEVTLNQRWRFNTNAEKVAEFQKWLQSQIELRILATEAGRVERAYWTKYIEEGFKKGAGRAFDDVRKAGAVPAEKLDFYRGTKREFLQQAFGQPETVEKVQLLAGRTYTDLKGVTEVMSTQMSRVLTDGLVQGKNPNAIAKDLNDRIEHIGRTRATTIARTEVIRAHAEGQLDAMERLGVEEVGVAVEWSTALDERVCPLCDPLEGAVLAVKEAHGMIPRHPRCRCSFIPANVGESTKGQKRSARAIREARDASIRREPGKGLTFEEKKDRSRWAGADLKVTKAPESILKKQRRDSDALEIGKFRTPKELKPKKPRAAPKPKQPEQIMRAASGKLTRDELRNEIEKLEKSLGSVNIHGMTKPDAMRGVTVDGIRFGWSETRRDQAINELMDVIYRDRQIPDKLWGANYSVYWTDQANSADDHWRNVYKSFSRSNATGGDGRILVYGGGELSTGTFAHESGHNLATKLWGSTHPPANSAYGIAQTLEPPVTPYAANSTSEDFAEACKLFVLTPRTFKQQFPNKYAAIKELIGG